MKAIRRALLPRIAAWMRMIAALTSGSPGIALRALDQLACNLSRALAEVADAASGSLAILPTDMVDSFGRTEPITAVASFVCAAVVDRQRQIYRQSSRHSKLNPAVATAATTAIVAAPPLSLRLAPSRGTDGDGVSGDGGKTPCEGGGDDDGNDGRAGGGLGGSMMLGRVTKRICEAGMPSAEAKMLGIANCVLTAAEATAELVEPSAITLMLASTVPAPTEVEKLVMFRAKAMFAVLIVGGVNDAVWLDDRSTGWLASNVTLI